MKKLVTVIAVLLLASACTPGQQAGSDISGKKFTLQTDAGKAYSVSTNADGTAATVTEKDSSGKSTGTATGKVTVANGIFTLSVTLDNGTVVILSGDVDGSGNLSNISLKIDNKSMNVTSTVASEEPTTIGSTTTSTTAGGSADNGTAGSDSGTADEASYETPTWLTGAWCYNSGQYDKNSVKALIFLNGQFIANGNNSVSCFKSPKTPVIANVVSEGEPALKQNEYFTISFGAPSASSGDDPCYGTLQIKVMSSDGTMQAFIAQGNLVTYKKSSLANVTEATTMDQACP